MRWLLAFGFLSAVGVCATARAADHTKDTPAVVKKNLQEGKAVLIDVRELSEWNAGHLKDARLLPLSVLQKKPEQRGDAGKLDKQKVVYLHCRSGVRCLTAADILAKEGYQVRALKAGYEDLLSSGFEKAGSADE